jgi:Holliday junction resolvase-like predicted endonuclease
MKLIPPSVLPWLLALASLAGATVAWWLFRARQRWRLARSRAQGLDGEVRALRSLKRFGFAILGEQVERTAVLMIDEQPVPFTVRADFMVRKSGRTAVVEVKTGASATFDAAATRRQLFEYAAIYQVEDVYLFDATSDRLYHTRFPHLQQRTGRRFAWRSTVERAVLIFLGIWAGIWIASI